MAWSSRWTSGWEDDWSSPRWKGKKAAEQDNRTWAEKYTYLNGPAKAPHTLTVEDRCWLIREIVVRAQADSQDVLKIPVVRTLTWPADIVDAVLFLLTGLGRRVALRSLGETGNEVADSLAEAFSSRSPPEADMREVISGIIDRSQDHEALLEAAYAEGFEVTAAAAQAAAGPRWDSRARAMRPPTAHAHDL